MRKRTLIAGLCMAAVLLTGCGDSSDYSKYVTLGDYKNLSAELSVQAVTDQDLENYIKEQLADDVEYKEVKGPVTEGQMVQVLLTAKDGNEVVYDFAEDGYELTVGQQEFGEEVDEALIGTVIGDTLDLTVSYDDSFEDAMLCGKEINYQIEVQKISDVSYPELTDAYVKENFGEESTESWKQTLKDELTSERQAEATESMRDELVQKAVDTAEITGYPKSLYKERREAVQEDYKSYAAMFECSVDEIYEMFQVTQEDLEKQYLDETNRTMVLALIRQQENITLSEEQLSEKLEAFAADNEYDSVQQLLQDYEEEDLKQYFLDEETKDFLEEHADISINET